MKHQVKITYEEKKRGLFGTKKVLQTKTVTMDDKTYRKLKKQLNTGRSITLDDLIMYDCIFED